MRPTRSGVRGRWPRALVALAYAIGTLVFFEGVARLTLSLPFFVRCVGLREEPAWRLRWERRPRGRSSIYYGFDVHHPVRGWAVRPDVRNQVMFGDRVLSTNSEGVRGVREYARTRAPGTQRVLVLGDSFTFGDEVSDDETYAHFLEELLPGVEVVNLGVHGYGHDQMLLYLREVGARYAPDLVLLGFVADDMERSLLGFRDFAKPRFALVDGGLELHGTPVPSPEEVSRTAWRRSRFLDLFAMLHHAWLWRSGRATRRMQALTGAILDEIQREAEGLGARVAFAYLPIHGEIVDSRPSLLDGERFLLRYCRQRGVACWSVRPLFRSRLQAGVRFKVFDHWGPREHCTAAEAIRAELLQRSLVRADAAARGCFESTPLRPDSTPGS